MGILKKIAQALFGSKEGEIQDKDGIYFYVKCSKCGAPVRIRVDKRHDLQPDFDSESGGYILRKEIMDGSCFSLIYATLHFNGAYHITEQEINGGEFITWEEYRKLARSSTSSGEG